jgi:hypothetical protein
LTVVRSTPKHLAVSDLETPFLPVDFEAAKFSYSSALQVHRGYVSREVTTAR